MYSYPLGDKKDTDSELLAYFDKETLDLNRLVITAKSLDISKPFTLYAVQPITPGNLVASPLNQLQCHSPKKTWSSVESDAPRQVRWSRAN